MAAIQEYFMVNQQVEEQSRQTPGQDSEDDFRIVDSTPPDQLEVEAELDNEIAQTEEIEQAVEVDGEEVSTGRDMEREPEAASQQQQQIEPVDQQEPEPQQTPPPRTYSVEEVARIQAAKDREIQEARRRAELLEAERTRYQIEQNVEQTIAQQEADLAVSVGAEEARRLARSAQNVAAVRQGQEAIQRAAQLERQVQESQATQEQQAKYTVARQLMDQHGLQTDDYELLLGTTTPTAMSALAQRLATQTVQQRQARQDLRDTVPPETPQTALENGRSTGTAPETPQQKLNRIRQKPGWQWTEDELRFMRDGE